MGPLVSIGLPTYNRPLKLRAALQSLLNQSYRNLEIIVSDNATPGDEVAEVMRELTAGHSNIRFYRQVENIGMLENFKFVVSKATGKYFMWLSDDDSISCDFIEKAVLFLEAHPDYSMATGKVPAETINQLSYSLPEIDLEGCDVLTRLKNYILAVSLNNEFYSLIKLEHAVAFRDLPFYPGSDWLWVCYLLTKGKLKSIPGIYLEKELVGASNSSEAMCRLYRCSKFKVKCHVFWLYGYGLRLLFRTFPGFWKKVSAFFIWSAVLTYKFYLCNISGVLHRILPAGIMRFLKKIRKSFLNLDVG